ncbi:Prp21p [Saccharomyces cerevisiae YJM1400]|nr:Prp21p [Saccharomyces cerevisiae YJM1479]AJR74231.1 Prp21p [Saccharomyces cerevisiae YJM1549]AJV45098.1 Prp21p [Saccharomyces cerevisiae YJM1400]
MEPEDTQLKEDIKTTVNYIKQHGVEFENKLLEDERFSFIKKDDPLHEYYTKLMNEPTVTVSGEDNDRKSEREIARPPDFLFSQYDTGISRRDMEVIKLTARYYAKDKSIVEQMISKDGEARLNFMNSSHPLHKTFTDFVAQYKRVYSFIGQEIKKSKRTILDNCFERAQYWEFEKDKDREHDKLVELCKIQFAAIPWDKFTQVAKFSIPEDTEIFEGSLDLEQMRLRRVQTGIKLFDSIKPTNEEEKIVSDQGKQKGGDSKGKKRKIRAVGETRLKKSKK